MTDIPSTPYAGKLTVCIACGEPIEFLMHERTGAIAPITVASYPNGNILALPKFQYRIFGPKNAEAERKSGSMLRLNHFVSCPNAKRFRR